MLDIELFIEFGDHRIVEICTIICDDPLRDTVTTDEVLLDKLGDNILGDGSEGGCLHLFCKIVNGH